MKRNKKYSYKYKVSGDVGYKLFWGGVCLSLGFVIFTLASSTINAITIISHEDKVEGKLKEAKMQVEESIKTKLKDVNNFDLASVELLHSDNEYICKAFGRTGIKSVLGLEQDKYVNLFFNISKEKAQGILDSIKLLENSKIRKEYGSPEHTSAIKESTMGSIFDLSYNGKIKKTTDACIAVYEAINDAVKNAYSFKIEGIADSKQFNEKLASNYRYVKNEIMTDLNGAFSNSKFVNSGIMTTGISSVARNEQRNESYFYIDTLQAIANGKPGEDFEDFKLDSCRTMVVIEGANLTNEEVYAKFIRGEQKEFIELVRHTNSEKVGIYDGKVKEDVEEIEFLF